ncbi:MAG TPA: GntR family transcriptional regulator [Casimicrobiaceae bacterium]|nr:GntR family transcriptional regulator [Casimicrobiaceae bacterium]
MTATTLPALQQTAPLYREVKRRLMDTLARGEWRPGDAIPAERRLSEQYGISIGTLRKAIDELCAENILIRQQGRGTYVASHNRDRNLFYFFHVVPENGPKSYPEVELLAFGRGKADRVAAERLGIEAGDAVVRIRNRLRLAGAPIVIDDITLSSTRFAGLTERQFRARPSTIYNLYQESFGISVVRTRERVRAMPADEDVAGLLDVPRGAPLLQVRRVAYAYQDVPVEYRVSLVNTEHHEYYAEIGA